VDAALVVVPVDSDDGFVSEQSLRLGLHAEHVVVGFHGRQLPILAVIELEETHDVVVLTVTRKRARDLPHLFGQYRTFDLASLILLSGFLGLDDWGLFIVDKLQSD